MTRAALIVLALGACGGAPPRPHARCALPAGANASLTFESRMSDSFRLEQLTFEIDGAPAAERSTLATGTHTARATVVYRGHGTGVFAYLAKYTFTAHGDTTFVVEPNAIADVVAIGYERTAGAIEQRPAIDWRVALTGRCDR